MLKSSKSVFLSIASAMFLVGVAGCSENSGSTQSEGQTGSALSETPVDIAMQTWIGYSYAVIAHEQGYYGDMPVRMSLVEDGTALISGISGGGLEMIGTTLDQYVEQRTQGLDAELVALTDDSYGGDGLTVTDEITSLEDIEGKSVAYTPGPSSEYVLATALQSVGLSLKDIQAVTFPDPSGTVSAFVNGQVDAAIIFQPFLEQTLARPGSRLLFTTREFPNISVGCFIIKEDLPQGDEIVARFIDGLKQAEAFAAENPEEANAILRDFFQVDQALLDTMSDGARLKSAEENVDFFSAEDGEPRVMELLENLEAHYRRLGRAGDTSVSTDDIADNAAAEFAE